MDAEVFSKALEKLEAHGGAIVDFDGMVTKGGRAWRDPYARQCQHRQTQLEKMLRFAEGGRCRMSMLVDHFGDDEDAGQRCGLCDFCSPEDAIAQVFRPLRRSEEETVLSVVRALRSSMGMSTGKLHKQLFPNEQIERDEFEALLVAMARGNYAVFEDAEFEKDGRTIAYRKVSLTDAGEEIDRGRRLHMFLPDAPAEGAEKTRVRGKGKAPAGSESAQQRKLLAAEDALYSPQEVELEKKLRTWRREEAKKNGFPAFRIFGDKTLRSIVLERPLTIEDLLRVDGIGPEKASRFGESICAICSGNA
jgi:superfamily II DNA helicase RecQ